MSTGLLLEHVDNTPTTTPPESAALWCSSCRFCLRADVSMRSLPHDQLLDSDIPRLFETVTAVQLDLAPAAGYSELLCVECERQMRSAAATRTQLLHVVERWQRILRGLSGETKLAGDEAESAMVEGLKTEPETEDDAARDDSDDTNIEEDDEEHAAQTTDDCDDDDSEQEHKKRIQFGRPQRGQLLTCEICNDQLKNKTRLLRHMRSHHQQTTCPLCGKTNLKRLAEHLRHHRQANRHTCAYCPRTFTRLPQKHQHERLHTGERPFICEVCAYTFTSPTALKKHARQQHSRIESESTATTSSSDHHKPAAQVLRKPIQPSAGAVVQKLPPHVGIRLECPLCHHTYVNRKSMQPHMKLQHGSAGVAAWKRILQTTCLLCGDRFADGDALDAHRLRVHQTHECSVCRRRFQSRLTLQLHAQRHSTKERRFECPHCEQRYTCAYTLRMHQRRAHTGERPFRCEHCRFAFAEQWHLNSHLKKQHSFASVLKPHGCAECGATFRTAGLLRSHREQHTGRFRYPCAVCKRNLHAGPLLEQHMRSYHAAEWRAAEEESGMVEEEEKVVV